MSFDRIKSLMSEWKLDEALELINKDKLDESIEFNLLTSEILIQKGAYRKSLEYSGKALQLLDKKTDFILEVRARVDQLIAL